GPGLVTRVGRYPGESVTPMSRITHAAEARFPAVTPLSHVPRAKRGVFFRAEGGAGVGEIGKATRPGKYRVKRVAAGLRGYEEIPSRLGSYRPGHTPLRTVSEGPVEFSSPPIHRKSPPVHGVLMPPPQACAVPKLVTRVV